MNESSIRLACFYCDRTDCDGITAERVRELESEGWEEIDEALNVDHDGWWTHLGYCPDCVRRERERDELWEKAL